MSFTAFGRGFEHNGSTSDPKGADRNGTNTNGHDAAALNGNGHTHLNGNGHVNGNGHSNGHATECNGITNGNGQSSGVGSRFQSIRATLSSGVSIKGTVTFRSELTIDGEVEGTIQSFGRLTL